MMCEERDRPRIVVCAACREPESDLIFCGPRHFDMVMHRQIAAAGMTDSAIQMEQGFIDQNGVFMDREEAMRVARAARQFVDVWDGTRGDLRTLYSEGLY